MARRPAENRRPRTAARRPTRILAAALAVLLVGAGLAACTQDDDTLVIYSGRTKELVDPLLQEFAEDTGTDIEVRYGDSADLALAIDAEGDRGRADVFLSQSPGAIGYLSANDRLARLDQSVLDEVPEEDRSAEGRWVGLSGRARVLVYDPDVVSEDELPQSVEELTGEEYRGKVAVAPTNGSFIDFVSGLRQVWGDEKTEAWLKGMADNDAPTYANNNAILEAVDRGEVPMGLANHYYLERARQEDPDISARNHFFPSEDPGSMLLVTAVGIPKTSRNKDLAERFIRYLLSKKSQRYFTEETMEFPLVAGVEPAGDLPRLSDLPVSRIDLDRLGDELSSTLDMIRDSGIQR